MPLVNFSLSILDHLFSTPFGYKNEFSLFFYLTFHSTQNDIISSKEFSHCFSKNKIEYRIDSFLWFSFLFIKLRNIIFPRKFEIKYHRSLNSDGNVVKTIKLQSHFFNGNSRWECQRFTSNLNLFFLLTVHFFKYFLPSSVFIRSESTFFTSMNQDITLNQTKNNKKKFSLK